MNETNLPIPNTEREAISGVYFKQYLPVSNKVLTQTLERTKCNRTLITWCSQVQYDLIVAANALSELSTVGIRQSTISSLWRKTGSILVSKVV